MYMTTLNNISVVLWQSILLLEETGVSGRKPSTCLIEYDLTRD